MRFAPLALYATLCLAPIATAQRLELKFDALAAKASGKTEVDLDSKLLRLAMRAAGDADLNGILSGVQAIHVREYEFNKAGAYSQSDLEPLRKQVAAQSRWSQVLSTKEDGETTEFWIDAQADKVSGCLIVSAGERELSVIYLEGTMTLAQMKRFMDEDARHELGDLFGNH